MLAVASCGGGFTTYLRSLKGAPDWYLLPRLSAPFLLVFIHRLLGHLQLLQDIDNILCAPLSSPFTTLGIIWLGPTHTAKDLRRRKTHLDGGGAVYVRRTVVAISTISTATRKINMSQQRANEMGLLLQADLVRLILWVNWGATLNCSAMFIYRVLQRIIWRRQRYNAMPVSPNRCRMLPRVRK